MFIYTIIGYIHIFFRNFEIQKYDFKNFQNKELHVARPPLVHFLVLFLFRQIDRTTILDEGWQRINNKEKLR
jgi:hypothetical protein